MEDIKDELKNGRKTISEKIIKSKYSKKYKINYNTFVNKYFKELKKMRSNEHSLKEYSGDGEISWGFI